MKTLDAYLRLIPDVLTRESVEKLITQIVNEATDFASAEYDNGYADGYDEGLSEDKP